MTGGQRSCAALVLGLGLGPAAGQSLTTDPLAPAAELRRLPAQVSVGIERVRLPEDEAIGLVGASLLLAWWEGWWVGPAVYGAAAGRRGGLFTWGVEGQRRGALTPDWTWAAGLYVGGGGGAGAPVGGGLMLRPHLDLMVDWGRWTTGLSLSQVRFPTGAIDSVQLGLQLALRRDFLYTDAGHHGQVLDFAGAGGLGAERIDAVLGHYATGSDRDQPFSLVGVRLEWPLSPVLAGTLEARGAAQGGADGYAEMTAGLQALWPVDGPLRVGVHGAVGLGGGGGVSTGGGTLAKLGLTGRLAWGRHASWALEGGRILGLEGHMTARMPERMASRYVQVSVGVVLDPDRAPAADAPAPKTVHDMAWSLSLQTYRRAPRKDGRMRSLGTLGLKFQRALGEHLYLSGQGHGAVVGGAGAYSSGLLGLGTQQRLAADPGWRVGIEFALGAAGGGGVNTGGGAIVQPMAWLGRDVGRHGRLTLAAGTIRSWRGPLASPVVELGGSWTFGVP